MILNVYKEPNWTSFDVVAKIRNTLRERRGTKKVKVGHAGTLDPLAEGVLIVVTDMDTKKQDEILNDDKEYVAKIAIGASSASYDLETPLEFADNVDFEYVKNNLNDVISKYVGEFEQQIPAYSAKKIDGKKLYELSREGKSGEIELPTKKVNIYSIKLESITEESLEDHTLPVLTCRVLCSKGTYIRSLANDIGNDLGFGGVLLHLIRTRVGDFYIEDAKKLGELKF